MSIMRWLVGGVLCILSSAGAYSTELVAPVQVVQLFSRADLIVVTGRATEPPADSEGWCDIAVDEVLATPTGVSLPRSLRVRLGSGNVLSLLQPSAYGLFFLAVGADGSFSSLTNQTPAAIVYARPRRDDVSSSLAVKVADRLIDTIEARDSALALALENGEDPKWIQLSASQVLLSIPASAKHARLAAVASSTRGFSQLLAVADLVAQGELNWVKLVRQEVLQPSRENALAAGMVAYHLIWAGPVEERRQLAFVFVGSTDPEVRRSAAQALQDSSGKTDLPRLRKLLDDSDSFVRWSSAKAIARIMDKPSFSLTQYLADEQRIRQTVIGSVR